MVSTLHPGNGFFPSFSILWEMLVRERERQCFLLPETKETTVGIRERAPDFFFKKKRSVGGNPGVAPIFLSPPVGIMLIYASPRIFLPPLPPPLSEEEECKAGRPAEYKLSSFLIFFAHHLPFPLFSGERTQLRGLKRKALTSYKSRICQKSLQYCTNTVPKN